MMLSPLLAVAIQLQAPPPSCPPATLCLEAPDEETDQDEEEPAVFVEAIDPRQSRYDELYDAAEAAKSLALETGDYGPAIAAAQAFVDFGQENYPPGHPNARGPLWLMGYVLQFAGRPREAEPFVTEALRRGLADPERGDFSEAMQQAYLLYTDLGLFDEAERALLSYIDMEGGQDGPASPERLSNIAPRRQLAELYLNSGRIAEAESTLNSLLRTIREIEQAAGEEAPYLDSIRVEHSIVLSILGHLYLAEDRFPEAERSFLEARRLDLGDDPAGEDDGGAIHFDMLELYLASGRLAEAERLLRQVVTAPLLGYEPWDELTHRAQAYRRLARFSLDRGELDRAEGLLEAGLSEWRARVRSTQSADAGLSYDLARLRLRAGRGEESALQLARTVARWLENSLAVGADNDFDLADGAPVQWGFSIVPDAIWANERAGAAIRVPTEEVFGALQRSTSDPAGDAIIRTAIRAGAANTDPELAALIDRLESVRLQMRRNSERYAGLVAGEVRSPDEAASIERERMELEERARSAELSLRGRYPNFYEQLEVAPLSVAEAQNMLRGDEALVLVVPSEFGTHVVALSRTESLWTRSDLGDAEVSRRVDGLLGQLTRAQSAVRRAGGVSPQFDRAVAHELFQSFFAPVRQVLQGKRRLFVVPARSLTRFPFAVLVTEPPAGSDSDAEALAGTRWLTDEHALIQLPSIRSLAFLRAQRARPADGANDGFVGFGDPVLDPPTGRVRPPAPKIADLAGRGGRFRSGAPIMSPEALRAEMDDLPGTADELEQLRRLFRAPQEALFVRHRATETEVKHRDLRAGNVIVFATHALVAGDLTGVEEPGLVLTPPAAPTELDDGYLSASEVAGLRLAADWVILSACNTALGDTASGNPGLSRLTRAFFSAGARNVLASLWPVLDDAAPLITARMMQLVSEDASLNGADAFNAATGELRRRTTNIAGRLPWAHPTVWAPFILIGDGAH